MSDSLIAYYCGTEIPSYEGGSDILHFLLSENSLVFDFLLRNKDKKEITSSKHIHQELIAKSLLNYQVLWRHLGGSVT